MAEPGADGGDTGTGTDGCFFSGTLRKTTPKSRPRPRHKKSAQRCPEGNKKLPEGAADGFDAAGAFSSFGGDPWSYKMKNIRTTNVETALTRDQVMVGCNLKRVPVGGASLVAGGGEGFGSAANGFLSSGGDPW